MNGKLPWAPLEQEGLPPAYFEDLSAGRDPGNRYFVARFQSWTIYQKSPVLEIIDNVGEIGSVDAEVQRILCQSDVCRERYENKEGELLPHFREMLKELIDQIDPGTGQWQVPEEEIAKRLDHRKKRIFTIDPPTSRDLDDALSVEKISDSIFEVGVYIADPTHFIKPGSPLDLEAQKRCTTTYTIPEVFPMIPRILCEKFCSLDPSVDRLAFAVIFRFDVDKGELDKTFEPVIGKAVIRSAAKWSY